jgi:gluconate 2-dehydrogenase gamma chain
MNNNDSSTTLTRRTLLRGGSLYGGGLYLALNAPRPLAAVAAAESGAAEVLSTQQWKTVRAITGRIIPTDHQPGAIEANCINFIDKALANEDSASAPDFTTGLSLLDTLCRNNLGKPFVDLNPAEQDQVLTLLESDTAAPWKNETVTAANFFELIRALTIMGFMADPKYGGNVNFSGWQVARYPGPRHHKGGYTPAQMLGEEQIITIWGEKM